MSMPFIAVGNEELVKAGRTGSLIFSECQAIRGREGAGIELVGVLCWGSLAEYRDTSLFSRDTSVFAHRAKVTVPKLLLAPGRRRI